MSNKDGARAVVAAPRTDRALYSELIHIAAELARGTDFLSTCPEDMNPRLKRADILKTAERQEGQLKDWANRVRQVADKLSAAPAETAACICFAAGNQVAWEYLHHTNDCPVYIAGESAKQWLLDHPRLKNSRIFEGAAAWDRETVATLLVQYAEIAAPADNDAALTRAALAFAGGQEMSGAELETLKARLAAALRAAQVEDNETKS